MIRYNIYNRFATSPNSHILPECTYIQVREEVNIYISVTYKSSIFGGL